MGKEFATAEGKRVQITNEQAKQIRNLYKELSDEYKDRLRILSTKTTVSARLREQYFKDYVKDLERDMQYLNNNLENTITSNMLRVAEAVVDDSMKLDKEMGFGGIMTKQFYIPQDVVAIVSSGELYKGKWTLSDAIWTNNQKQLDTIDQIIAKGVAGNKSALEIAKDLERYVTPSSARQSRTVTYNKHEIDANGNRVVKMGADGKPVTGKYYFGKVDYNAQRLARTMVSHAYQESFVECTKDNPFIESYRWLASGGDRMCPVCEERDGQIYDKDSLPMDHPNGMCTFEVVIEKSYEEIGRELADWVNGEGDPELNAQIDNYADSLGFNVKQMTAGTEQVKKYSVYGVGDVLGKNTGSLNNENDADIQKAYENVNPNYDPSKTKEYDPYQWNCNKCVVAFEANMRGYNVEALPYVFGTDNDLSDQWYKTFGLRKGDGWDVGKGKIKDTAEEIAWIMSDFGKGSRAVLSLRWKTGTGHVLNVVQTEEGTKFIDAQCKQEVDISVYLKQAVLKTGGVNLYRVDDTEFNEDLLERCVKARE